jgi:hypothetical protein
VPLRLEKAPGQSPLHDVKDAAARNELAQNLALLASALLARSAMAHRSVGRGPAPKDAREFQQMGSGVGGARRDRTDDLLLAKQALSQLSYGPGRRSRQKPEARNQKPE